MRLYKFQKVLNDWLKWYNIQQKTKEEKFGIVSL